MPSLTELESAFAAAGAAAWGGVSFSKLMPGMEVEAIQKVERLCANPSVVLVAAFPYYTGDRPGNLSLYARGEDYHRVLVRRLSLICDFLRACDPSHNFLPAADQSPLPEQSAAWLAGLGIRGKHGLLILPPYGSYIFLGTILTDAPIQIPPAYPTPACESCGQCIAACPSKALGEGGFCPERCLSHLTQKKGVLSPEEEEQIAVHPYVWGCDLCQQVCPYNRMAAHTGLSEFSSGLVDSLTPDMLEGLTNRTFQEKFGNRAFAWRGPAVIRRNLALQERKDSVFHR